MKKPWVVCLSALFACVLCTTVVVAKVDLQTPKSAADGYAMAVERGSLDSAKLASIGGDEEYRMVELLGRVYVTGQKMKDTAIAKLGNRAADWLWWQQPSIREAYRLAEEKIEGDRAWLVGTVDNQRLLALTKTPDGWKVDLANHPQRVDFDIEIARFTQTIVGMNAITADLNSGKIADIGQLLQAMTEQATKAAEAAIAAKEARTGEKPE